MRKEIIDSLYELCAKTVIDINKIKSLIKDNAMSSEEITHTAMRLLEDYGFECNDYEFVNGRKPLPCELVSSNFVDIFEAFIAAGLDPNMIVSDNLSESNVVNSLFYCDNVAVTLPILKALLDIGGDPNLMVDGETVFEMADFDVWLGAIEQYNREKYEMWVKFWLLLIAYGGRGRSEYEVIKMKNGYTFDIFKDYERISFSLEFIKSSKCFLHVYLKDTGEEIAVSEL